METPSNIEPVKKKIKLDFKDSKYATGRRKRSIAKVWLKKGSGNIHVNGIKMNEYFKKENLKIKSIIDIQVIQVVLSRLLQLYCLRINLKIY